jgi:hypothetical protein
MVERLTETEKLSESFSMRFANALITLDPQVHFTVPTEKKPVERISS